MIDLVCAASFEVLKLCCTSVNLHGVSEDLVKITAEAGENQRGRVSISRRQEALPSAP